MPWRLCRYILVDLLRVVGLTTAVLVTVIAFGATIKPLADNSLLSAGQAAWYMVLVMVPMMQFALPFAAGFAATLSMHRMTTDNEILAAAVGGISYSRLLAPIAALGLALTLLMVLLTQWAIPQFWGLMEQTIARDVTKIFQASLQRGEPFDLDNLQIYADYLRVDSNPTTEPGQESEQPAAESIRPNTRLILWGVAAAEMDDDGRIVLEVTAESAVIDIYRRAEGTILKLALHNTVAFKEDEGALARLPMVEHVLHVPRVFEDDARAMTRGRLLEMRKKPDEYGPVIEARRDLAVHLRDLEQWSWIDQRLAAEGRAEFIEPGGAGRRFVVHADRLRKERFLSAGGDDLLVEQFEGVRATRSYLARKMFIDRARAISMAGSQFRLILHDVEVTDLKRGGEPNPRKHLTLSGLTVAGMPETELQRRSSAELFRQAEAVENPEKELRTRIGELHKEHRTLQLEITSRLWKRYALSATGFLLLTLGATLAMWLRESAPLTIYLWSFAPAVGDLIVISGGEHVMRDGSIIPGFLVMWSGNAVLLGLLGFVYYKLSRH